MRLFVDVCSGSQTAAASLLALLFWQLADDNRWRALITSSQRGMNSYPVSSQGIFTVRRDRREKDRKAAAAESVPLLYIYIFFQSRAHPTPLPPNWLPHSCTHTHPHQKKKKKKTQARALRAAPHSTFMGQKTVALI